MKFLTFQEIIQTLQNYWVSAGCALLQPYDLEVGAGTFHPATLIRTLGADTWNVAFMQPCRRPSDSRYGRHPNRWQHYYQFQVVMKPSPDDLQELYLGSLKELGIDPKEQDIRFVEDDWESPTVGASGLGWEIWCNGLEISQFTYMQIIGGINCFPAAGELTYGLERIAMYIQNKDNFNELIWTYDRQGRAVTYADIFLSQEQQFSAYNLLHADTEILFSQFEEATKQFEELIEAKLPLPAYDFCIKASHLFNLLEARRVISVTERAKYIGRVREMAKEACSLWLEYNNKEAV